MKRECETCIKRKTLYCPTSIECMATDDMPYYQNRIMLLEENEQLQEKIENLELNWKIIKQYCLDEQIPEEYDEYNSCIEFSNSVYDNILNKLQELEQGSDSNE